MKCCNVVAMCCQVMVLLGFCNERFCIGIIMSGMGYVSLSCVVVLCSIVGVMYDIAKFG